MADYLDKRIAALGRLGRTKGGRAIIKAHGPAILSLMCMPPSSKDAASAKPKRK